MFQSGEAVMLFNTISQHASQTQTVRKPSQKVCICLLGRLRFLLFYRPSLSWSYHFHMSQAQEAVSLLFMTKIEANVPDYLAKQAFAVAAREKVSMDQIVALALSAQVEVWRMRDDM